MRAVNSRATRALADSVARTDAKKSNALFEPLEDRTLMSTTYYVSPSGSDSNKGTSTSAPWKTIAKVDSSTFAAGDSILFQGGQSFSGAIKFNGKGGSSSSAITVGSYGSGRATVDSGTGSGFYDYNASGFLVENLNFVGSPGGLTQDGVKFEAASGGKSNVSVENCTISGYRVAGILLQGDGGNGFTGVNLTGNITYNNVDAGIETDSTNSSIGVHKNVTVANNVAYDNYGSGQTNCTGNGIELGSVATATVQYNDAYDNGLKGGSGNVGIWAYASTGVTVQYNISHGNVTKAGTDGDGFDFDLDTADSVMQYNYSYDNDGAGFMFDQWQKNANFHNNTVRYNISQNDGRANTYGGLSVFGQITNSEFYNNTVYMSGGGNSSGILVKLSTLGASYSTGLHFANNAVETTGGKPLVSIGSSAIHGSNITFAGDDFYAGGSSTSINFGSSYSSVAAWASATGQEKVNGKVVGLQASPSFVSAGSAPALDTPSKITSITAYDLTSSSPLIGAGVNVASLYGSITPAATVVSSSKINIGAYQGGTVATPPVTPPPTTTTVPTGWTSADIGAVDVAGSSTYAAGVYTIAASGTDVQGTADSFHYDYTTLTGNGQIVAKVTGLTKTNAWSKAGVMFRDGAGASATEAALTVSPNGIADFQRRTSVGGITTNTHAAGSAPQWVKLVRVGDLITGYVSTDDVTWTTVGSASIAMNAQIEVGVAATSHDNGTLATATFDNVAVTS